MVCERCIKLSKQTPPSWVGAAAARKIGVHKYMLTIFCYIVAMSIYFKRICLPFTLFPRSNASAIRGHQASGSRSASAKTKRHAQVLLIIDLSRVNQGASLPACHQSPSQAKPSVKSAKTRHQGGSYDNEVIWIGGGQRDQRQPPSTPHPPSPNARSS